MFTCVSVLEYLMSLQSHYFTLLNASIESITQIEMDLARFFPAQNEWFYCTIIWSTIRILYVYIFEMHIAIN